MARERGYLDFPRELTHERQRAAQHADRRGRASSRPAARASRPRRSPAWPTATTSTCRSSPATPSCSPPRRSPATSRLVYRTVDNLFRLGASVLYNRIANVHVRGHAAQEELKIVQALVRPKFFVPIHGEYRHLVLHAAAGARDGRRRGERDRHDRRRRAGARRRDSAAIAEQHPGRLRLRRRPRRRRRRPRRPARPPAPGDRRHGRRRPGRRQADRQARRPAGRRLARRHQHRRVRGAASSRPREVVIASLQRAASTRPSGRRSTRRCARPSPSSSTTRRTAARWSCRSPSRSNTARAWVAGQMPRGVQGRSPARATGRSTPSPATLCRRER